MKALRAIGQSCLAALRGGGTIVLWTMWLGLSLLLLLQLYVVTKSELAMPDFALRRLERALGESGLRVTFDRTSFDPTGRALVENARFSLPEWPEPIVTARALYVRLDPWLMALGQFVPREIRVIGARAVVPAMLSGSGRTEEVVRDLDVTLIPAKKQMGIAHFSAHIGGVPVTARGAFAVTGFDPDRPKKTFAEIISTQFPKWCRQALAVREQLDALEAPTLDLELAPLETHAAMVDATLSARALNLERPLTAQLHRLRVSTRLPLFGQDTAGSRLELHAGEIILPLQATAREVRAVLLGQFRPGGFEFTPSELQITAGNVRAAGIEAEAFSADLFPQPLPKLEARVVARILGAATAIQANADFNERTALLRLSGAIPPGVLTPLSDRLGTDVRRFFNFTALHAEGAKVRLGPGWKFEKLTARVAARGIDAYRVKMEEGVAEIELTPERLYAPRAFARIGRNFAGGSYEHDLRTHEFRFLLEGQLRPLDISGWFRDWWPRFFQRFDFAAAAPAASVDVRGFWREGRRTEVFVFADVAKPVVQGAAFDRVRTRLFIRPAFYDGLELLATQGERGARGIFTFVANPETARLQRLDLDLVSSVDLDTAAKIVGPVGEKIFAQFELAMPPEVKMKARFDGADAPHGAHQRIDLTAVTRGEFRFNGFPLESATFRAAVRDRDILVEDVDAGFGGGRVTGRAQVTGEDAARRVGFDFALKNASLGQAAAALQRFTAEREKRPPEPPGKFVKEKANVKIDFSASAEGKFDNPLSYQGSGNAVVQGEEIGELPLLGQLSELLKFTALRFTTAEAKFKIEGTKLAFSEVAIRGANSAIDAHGDYLLDRKELDFKAKLFPFQESESIIKSVVGAVLSPISNAFEVKLTGSLEKPEWAFVIGPTNFLRSLAPDAPDGAKPSGPGSAPVPTPTPAPAAETPTAPKKSEPSAAPPARA